MIKSSNILFNDAMRYTGYNKKKALEVVKMVNELKNIGGLEFPEQKYNLA